MRLWPIRGDNVVYRDPAARRHAGEIGRDEFAPPVDDLDGALREAFAAPPRLVTLPGEQWLATDVVAVPRRARFLDVTLVLDLPWEQTATYEHSKLYFAAGEPFEFSEERVVCFRIRWVRRIQTVRLLLPQVVQRARRARFRLDPFPYCAAGTVAVHSLRLVRDDERDDASRVAVLYALKEQVRQDVEDAEAVKAERCGHYPSGLSLELTPRCNLTCSHCSSHGTAELHRRHNRTGEMTVPRLERLAHEVFPSLTALGLVGRGEPLAVTRTLWEALMRLLRSHRVLLTAVTNGTMLPRRITPDVLPLIETLTVSVDGATPETFAGHRGGASLEQVLENVAAFHELRRASGLTRRPRLGFSWTLMRDNVAEFPRFLRAALDLEPDLVYARHLLVFFEHARDQSLLGRPDLANGPLREAYRLMADRGIRSDCPPLLEDPVRQVRSAPQPPGRRDRCMFVHRTAVVAADGEMPTCSAPFAQVAGRSDDEKSFARIWNGPVMRGVRAALDTELEWDQCRNCWYREGRYQAQRAVADVRKPRYDLQAAGSFTTKAWDFHDYAL
jgi:MoaA/NifB/PqqE/SkfB family radical SAM enzyme